MMGRALQKLRSFPLRNLKNLCGCSLWNASGAPALLARQRSRDSEADARPCLTFLSAQPCECMHKYYLNA
jgi:hypothetical protein